MHRIHWVKQQDFCLRLGLLKALLALLPEHGRSVDRQFLLRAYNKALFRSAKAVDPILEAEARRILGETNDTSEVGLTVADALLITSGSQSWGQPVDEKKSSKVLEWAHAVGLVGRGNQMTERAHLLRALWPAKLAAKFVSGEPSAWNPFTLSPLERALFFYHLTDLDAVMLDLAIRVGTRGPRPGAICAEEARRMTCDSMQSLLLRVQESVPINEMMRLRQLRELVTRMFAELSGKAVVRVGPARSRRSRGAPANTERRTSKMADHEAIPRFEILVDIGFLSKIVPPNEKGLRLWRARNAWEYAVSPSAMRFASASDRANTGSFHWNNFAAAISLSGLLSHMEPRRATPVEAVECLLQGYEQTKRRAGHTPFECVALRAVLLGIDRGLYFEIEDMHKLMLEIKRTGVLRDKMYFAAGNEVDRMFILIRPDGGRALLDLVRTEHMSTRSNRSIAFM